MGFANNTCSFTRFRILDTVPDELWQQIPDRLRKFAFRDIDDIPEVQSQGWTAFEDMLDTTWENAPPQKGAYLLFSLRVDTRRIPAGVVKKHLALALREEKARMQGKAFIARDRKQEIKEQVLLRLRRRFLPVPGTFDVLWATERNEVWFASTQDKMIDMFLEEFLKSFELHLEQMTPYNLASFMLDEESLIHLDQLESTSFTQ
jgi:hypothetical protein